MTARCVVQGTQNICPSTQLRAFYIHLVCTRPSLFCFSFYPFNRIQPLSLIVIFSFFFLFFFFNSNGAHKLTLRSLAFSRRFSQRPSLKKGLGQNWSILRPYASIVTGQSQHLQLSSTKQKFANVSPSFLLHLNGHSLFGQLILSVQWTTPRGEL